MASTMGVRPWIEDDSPTRELVQEPERIKSPPRHSMWQHVGQRLQRLLGSHEPVDVDPPASPPPERDTDQSPPLDRSCSPGSSVKKVGVVGLPRMATFRRQNSERRDRLEPVDLSSKERRALSATRQRALSANRPPSQSPQPPRNPARESASCVTESNDSSSPPIAGSDFCLSADSHTPASLIDEFDHDYPRFPGSRSRSSSAGSFERFRDGDARTQLEAELDSRWILNLSMHFRDKSDREKFFVTYAETPTRWRRVTVSCDYRNAEPGSLEMDLKELQYQRDKSIQIYESIRDSLPEIQFYNTVTNLKLETSEGRLHVHVTEDTNEIIPYPPKTSVEHILEDEVFRPREIRESELAFDSHISGFVYKVRYCGEDYIKKEIPGPDTVDEFLYEINALHALTGSDSVIQLEAIVVDDQRETVKGLLISFAEQGALVDLLYDHRGEISWDDRVRWARQAVKGLSEIHEEGYVQGDFTLSNIVVDGENNAKIIDINRRGCPVGWEPPEIAKKIQSNQRISMYIGEKSDLYQLGMTLWALAMDDDEPERHDLPLSTNDFPLHVPRWYSNIVDVCLQPQPRDRLSAKELLKMFPSPSTPLTRPTLHRRSSTARAIDKRYIEPSAAVEREDIERLGFSRPRHIEDDFTSRDSTVDPVFTEARSSSYQFDSGSSYVDITRGRRPASNVAHLNVGTTRHEDSGIGDINLPENCNYEPQIIPISPNFAREYDEVDLGGNPYLISRQSFDPEELDILDGHPRRRTRSIQNTLSRIESAVPETTESELVNHMESKAKNVDDEEEIDLEPDQIQEQRPALGHSSITSGSTPRNSSSILASSGTYAPPPPPALDLITADLAGFGGHPSLDEHSPHEPLTMIAPDSAEEPVATAAPDSREEPAANTAPDSAEEPEATAAPDSTEEPVAIAAPDSTEEPAAIAAPDSAAEPEATKETDSAEEPAAMTAPDSMEEPLAMTTTDSAEELLATTATDTVEEPAAMPAPDFVEEPEAIVAPDTMEEPAAMTAPDSMEEPLVKTATDSAEEPGAITTPDTVEEPLAATAADTVEEPETITAPSDVAEDHSFKDTSTLSNADQRQVYEDSTPTRQNSSNDTLQTSDSVDKTIQLSQTALTDPNPEPREIFSLNATDYDNKIRGMVPTSDFGGSVPTTDMEASVYYDVPTTKTIIPETPDQEPAD